MKQQVITNSFEETQQFGFELAQNLQDVKIIALHGDLGAGKTTFVQGFAKGLGITKQIISPTFIIMREYEIPELFLSEQSESKDKDSLRQAQAKQFFYHVDLYRIESEKDVEGLGLLEIIKDDSSIVVIEWPEKIENLLPDKRIDLFFQYIDDDKRIIVVE